MRSDKCPPFRIRDGRTLPSGRRLGLRGHLALDDFGYTHRRRKFRIDAPRFCSLRSLSNMSDPSTSPGLLSVNSLTYRYGDRLAVDDVSFTIRSGEVLGLLGPNGAGKTTTISCLSGLLSDYVGEMSFEDGPFRPAERASDRMRLGVVPQDLAIYENLSASQNLRLFSKLLGLNSASAATAVQEQLTLAGLADRADERVTRFSGGMKRRLNLAIGLLHRPPLIVLDEPTVGVDPQSRALLCESLAALRAGGTSILYTTHYMDEAQRLCDRIAIMCDGRIAAVGTQSELAESTGRADASLEEVFLHLTGRSLRDT